jgi:predicted Zn-dependent protease with MMP-like domain
VQSDPFEIWVEQALEQIPKEFLERMENVSILIEDFADRDTLDSLSIGCKWQLLGLYVGVPISEQSFFSANILPGRIHLYRRPILRAARGKKGVSKVIRDVIIHELGHHLGFDDNQLYSMTGPED